MRISGVVLALALGAANVASAADTAVTYLVDLAEFNRVVKATTSLEIEVFSDAACSSLVSSGEIAAGSGQLLIEARLDQRVSTWTK